MILGITLQDQHQLVGLGDFWGHTTKAKMLIPHLLGLTIRHWWVGRKVDRWTEEEQVEETVAVAHLDSNSLEAPGEVDQSLELGNKWFLLYP